MINKVVVHEIAVPNYSITVKELQHMIIYLYKKTHNKTGLQYLGQTTTDDPHLYPGSGVDWRTHIREHGYDVTTEILKECKTKEELSYWGRYYSQIWNIVESKNWANKIPESGGGHNNGKVLRENNKQRLLQGKHNFQGEAGSKHSTNLNLRLLAEGRHPSQSPEARAKMKLPKQKVTCPHCNKQMAPHLLSRFHGDKCKSLSMPI